MRLTKSNRRSPQRPNTFEHFINFLSITITVLNIFDINCVSKWQCEFEIFPFSVGGQEEEDVPKKRHFAWPKYFSYIINFFWKLNFRLEHVSFGLSNSSLGGCKNDKNSVYVYHSRANRWFIYYSRYREIQKKSLHREIPLLDHFVIVLSSSRKILSNGNKQSVHVTGML